MNAQAWEPAAKRTTLIKTAGILWVLVGMFLFGRGVLRLLPPVINTYLLIILGLVLGYLKYRFLFKKIITKNIKRIYELSPHKDKICIFAFQAMQSYLLVLVMIGLGILIRSLPIDKRIIGTLFVTIGSGLFIAGISYFMQKTKSLE